MTKKLQAALRKTATPMVLAISSSMTDLTIRSYVDTSGSEPVTIFTNADTPHSPISGNELTVPEDTMETASTVEDVLGTSPVIAVCESCSCELIASPSLAKELDGLDIHCTGCGAPAVASYMDDILEMAMDGDDDKDGEDDDEDFDENLEDKKDEIEDDDDDDDEDEDDDDKDGDDDDKDDAEDKPSDTSSSDDDEETVDADNPPADEETTEESDDNGEDSDSETTEETPADDAAETTEEPAPAADTPAEEPVKEQPADSGDTVEATAELAALDFADLDDDLRMMANAGAERVEIFLGDTHIGRIIQEQCSDAVKPLFKRDGALRKAFLSGFTAHHASLLDESGEGSVFCKDFGFNPSVFKVELSEMESVLKEEMDATTEEQVTERVETEIAAFNSTMKVAMNGINKGVLPGTSLLTEMASTLKSHGIQKPHNVARAVIEKASAPFLASCLEQSKIMREEGPAYTKGISRTIEAASFAHSDSGDNEVEDLSLLTSAIAETPATFEEAAVTIPARRTAAPKKSGSKYQGLFKSMNRGG